MASIAKGAGMSTTKLTQFNPAAKRLDNGTLAPGQHILVPTAGVLGAASPVPDPSIERYGSSTPGTHVVLKGETLGLIAKHNGVTVAALMRANALKRDLIFPGQILLLPKR
jgi:membrane-bound lytic murein transglycosylase D